MLVVCDIPGSVGPNTLNVEIAHNKLILDDCYWGGIFLGGLDDAIIAFNKISGTGFSAIYTGLWYAFDPVQTENHQLILFNDVSDFTAVTNDFIQWMIDEGWLPADADAAPIWLGPGTNDFLVIGRGGPNTVNDLGTNNHIILIGS